MRIAILVVAVLATTALAQRVDEYDGTVSPPTGRVAVLGDMPDGGCMLVEVCARMQSKDGGAQIQTCDQVRRELGGANQTTCLNVLQKAGNFWCSRQSACVSDSGL